MPSHPKGVLLERSLSILLPVRDDQSTLAATVQRLLEVLSDLPGPFELILIDDGSRDATIEVADELATRYPQVSAVRHAEPRGQEAAIESGLARSSGDIVLVRDRSGLRRIDRQRHESGHRYMPDRGSRYPLPRPNYLAKLENTVFEE